MPQANEHYTRKSSTVLLIGESKAGKTMSIFGLVAAGKKVRMIDTDGNTAGLVNKVMAECPDKAENLIIETVMEPSRKANEYGKMEPSEYPVVYKRVNELTTEWKTKTEDLGPLKEWGARDGADVVLVLDSFTLLSYEIYDYCLWEEDVGGPYSKPNFMPKKEDRIKHAWSKTGDYQRGLIMKLVSLGAPDPYDPDYIPISILVTAHPKDRYDRTKDNPTIIGRDPFSKGSFGENMPIHFPTVVEMVVEGKNDYIERYIRTRTEGDLKLACPAVVPSHLTGDMALAELFDALQGKGGKK